MLIKKRAVNFERGENERMLSETLTDGLKRYEIGSRIRTLRLGKKLGLVQLGEHTGLSAALLSKIERGNLFPTLPTLLRIAMVFGVGLDYFFVESDDNPIVQITRKDERVRLPNRPAEPPSYFFESLNFDVKDRTGRHLLRRISGGIGTVGPA